MGEEKEGGEIRRRRRKEEEEEKVGNVGRRRIRWIVVEGG